MTSQNTTINVENMQSQLDEAKRRWNAMEFENRQIVLKNAGIIRNFVEIMENHGRLPDKARQDAMENLVGVRSVQTLYNMIERSRMFVRMFPDEDLAYVYALVKLSGRPKGGILNEDQELLVIGSYLYSDWEIVLPSGKTKRSREKMQSKFIYSMLTQLFPDLKGKINEAYIKRFIKEKYRQDPILFTMAREGTKRVWQDFMPKLPGDISSPNEQWISDARALPFITEYKKRKCTVSLLTIIDQFSGYIVAWCAVPRIEFVDDKDYQKVDFREHHVRLLFGKALMDSNTRPKSWYTDNGSQYKAILPFFPLLATGEEDETSPILGFPGHPWGRGKVEVTLREFNKPLRKFSGFVRDEDDLQEWKRAHEKANVNFYDLEEILANHVENWNNSPPDKKTETRFELWANFPQERLPLPPLERIVHLASADMWGQARISDMGLRIKNKYYKPQDIRNEDDYDRWVNAVARGDKIVYCVFDSNGIERIIACLDGAMWEEMILVEDKRASRSQRKNKQFDIIKRSGGRLQKLRDEFLQLSNKYMGGVPRVSLDDEAILPSQFTETEPEIESEIEETNGQNKIDHVQEDTSNTSTSTSTSTSTKTKRTKGRKLQKSDKPVEQEKSTETSQANIYAGVDLSELTKRRREQREG